MIEFLQPVLAHAKTGRQTARGRLLLKHHHRVTGACQSIRRMQAQRAPAKYGIVHISLSLVCALNCYVNRRNCSTVGQGEKVGSANNCGCLPYISAPLSGSAAGTTILSMRSILISIVVPDPGLWVFQTLLISPFRNQIEVVVGAIHHVDSPRVAGIGVRNRADLVSVEDTDALTIREAGIRFRIVEVRRSSVDFLRGKRCLVVEVE